MCWTTLPMPVKKIMATVMGHLSMTKIYIRPSSLTEMYKKLWNRPSLKKVRFWSSVQLYWIRWNYNACPLLNTCHHLNWFSTLHALDLNLTSLKKRIYLWREDGWVSCFRFSVIFYPKKKKKKKVHCHFYKRIFS